MRIVHNLSAALFVGLASAIATGGLTKSKSLPVPVGVSNLTSQQPTGPTRDVRIVLSSLSYIKEDGDDKGEGDEPYLLVYGYGFHFFKSVTGVVSQPISLGVFRVGQEDDMFLGHRENHWAHAGRRYPIPTLALQKSVPFREGTVLGLTAVLVDRDGFDLSQRRALSTEIRRQIEARLKDVVDRTQPFPSTHPLRSADLMAAMGSLAVSPAAFSRIHRMGKGDADEIGGFRTVVLVSQFSNPTTPRAEDVIALIPKVDRSENTAIKRVNVSTRGGLFTMDFPSRAIEFLSPDYKYTGKCHVVGSVLLPTIQ